MRCPLVALVALAAGCPAVQPLSPCAEDRDCASGETCLFDGQRGDSYCASRCGSNADCAAERFCARFSSVVPDGGSDMLCYHRVRTCRLPEGDPPREFCNGLDDDCNGVVDDSCQPKSCWSDWECGVWFCTPGAPDGGPGTACRPAVGLKGAYQPCALAADCYNGNCFDGRCTPLCVGNECAPYFGCGTRYESGRATFGQCLPTCTNARCGDTGLVCVLVPNALLAGRLSDLCVAQDRAKLPLGATCTSPEACASLMCSASGKCTHRCALDADCQDVTSVPRCGFERVALVGGVSTADYKVCR